MTEHLTRVRVVVLQDFSSFQHIVKPAALSNTVQKQLCVLKLTTERHALTLLLAKQNRTQISKVLHDIGHLFLLPTSASSAGASPNCLSRRWERKVGGGVGGVTNHVHLQSWLMTGGGGSGLSSCRVRT